MCGDNCKCNERGAVESILEAIGIDFERCPKGISMWKGDELVIVEFDDRKFKTAYGAKDE